MTILLKSAYAVLSNVIIRHDPVNTTFIIPAHCIVQLVKRILMPDMVMPSKKKQTEIRNAIADIINRVISLNLRLVMLVYVSVSH